MKLRSLMVAMALLISVAVLADSAPPADASEAFARLKTLVGEWKGDSKDARLSYELVAGGTTLLERESAADRPVMVTLYHTDGNRLLLTHYCMAGNQPRMLARSFDAKSGDLQFEFLDATNLGSTAAAHMHSVEFHFIDENHLNTEWQLYENGRPKMTETARYTRVR